MTQTLQQVISSPQTEANQIELATFPEEQSSAAARWQSHIKEVPRSDETSCPCSLTTSSPTGCKPVVHDSARICGIYPHWTTDLTAAIGQKTIRLIGK